MVIIVLSDITTTERGNSNNDWVSTITHTDNTLNFVMRNNNKNDMVNVEVKSEVNL